MLEWSKIELKDFWNLQRTVGNIRQRIDNFGDIRRENVVLFEDISPIRSRCLKSSLRGGHMRGRRKYTSSQKL